MTPEERRAGLGAVGEVLVFGLYGRLRRLRPYQLEVARAVTRSVIDGQARGPAPTFTVLFPRQVGKNELSAQLEAFLLFRHQEAGGSMVKVAPTFRPQIVTSLLRLEQMLAGKLTRGRWTKERGFIVRLGASSISFLSAQPDSHIVGATASLLLEADEAQDIDPEKWDRDLVPMGSSGAATRVLYGTPWTDDTLLGREVERNRELERRDGVRRHFEVGWEAVAAAVPAYGRHVQAEIARLGEGHPIVQTQYLLRPLSRADRLLSAEQLGKLRGEHPPLEGPGERPEAWGRGGFVAGLDVAGADEADPDGLLLRVNPRRDATVLTVAYAEDALVRALTPGPSPNPGRGE